LTAGGTVNTFGIAARINPTFLVRLWLPTLLLSALLASCSGGSPASGIATIVQPVNNAPVANGGAERAAPVISLDTP